jgi:hypothetical protein
MPGDSVDIPPPRDITGQECGVNQCSDGAVSSNLQDLVRRYNLDLPTAFYTIDFLSEQFGITDEGTYIGWDESSFEAKKSFYGQYGIQTETFITLTRMLEIWRAGGVVEVLAGGHTTAVSNISQTGDFVNIWVIDDAMQGQPGGLQETLIKINVTTSQVWAPAWVTSGGTMQFVGEYAVPEPASWAMLVAGFGLVGAVLRRRQAAIRADQRL